MASEKLTQLSQITVLDSTALFYVVQDSGTVPTSFKIQFDDLSTQVGPTVEVNGTPLTLQSTVNFVQGSNITITNPSNGNIQIDAATATPPPVVQVNGSPLITADPINFVQGANVTVSNPSAGVIQIDASTQGSSTIFQVNGVTVTSAATINFVQSTNMTITNPSAGNINFEASGGAGGGGLTLVQTQVLTGAATTITFSGLDGNTDWVYRLQGFIKSAAASNTISLLINGVATNLTLTRMYRAGGSNGGDDQASAIIQTMGSGGWGAIDILIMAKADPNSQSFSRGAVGSMSGASTTTATVIVSFGINYNDNSTNITSLAITASQANGIANGSYLSLYKYQQ